MSKLKELEKRLAVEPDNLGLRVTLAGAMRDAGRQTEAVELYRSVALVYRDQGRTQQAIAVCRSILEIAPDDVRCHALLATLVAGKTESAPAEAAQRARNASASLPARPSPPPRPQLATPPRAMPAVARTPTPTVEVRAKTGDVLEQSEELPTLRPRTGTPTPAPIPSIITPPVRAPAGSRPPADAPPRAEDSPSGAARRPASDRLSEPKRRSSFDETPLPKPLPYHVADPSTRSIERVDLPTAENVPTRPGSDTHIQPDLSGIANAARRISASLIAATHASGGDEDLSIELDTRQHARIESGDLAKIAGPPPTVPVEKVELTPPPQVNEDSVSAPRRLADVLPLPAPRDSGAPPPRPPPNRAASDEEVVTGERRDSFDDAITSPPVRPRDSVDGLRDSVDGPRDSDDLLRDSADAVPGPRDSDDEQTRPREMPGAAARRRTTTPAPKPPGAIGAAFFSPLPLERRADVLSRFHRRSLIANATVIRQGERNHPLVLVASGRLEVRADRGDGKVIQIGAVGPGEYVGEAALLARAPAPAHVIALTDVELLVLQPRDFYEIAGAYPALWAELKDVAERRTREHDAKLKR